MSNKELYGSAYHTDLGGRQRQQRNERDALEGKKILDNRMNPTVQSLKTVPGRSTASKSSPFSNIRVNGNQLRLQALALADRLRRATVEARPFGRSTLAETVPFMTDYGTVAR